MIDDIKEFRERLLERYEAAELVEVLNLDAEDIWNAFTDDCLRSGELIDELGFNIIDED